MHVNKKPINKKNMGSDSFIDHLPLLQCIQLGVLMSSASH